VVAVNGTHWAPSATASVNRWLSWANPTIDRPSGVVSASEESSAARANSSIGTAPTGRKAAACRLP